MVKGLGDIQFNVDSEKPLQSATNGLCSQSAELLVSLGYGNYSHGTHVAGIAAKEIRARLLAARMTCRHG